MASDWQKNAFGYSPIGVHAQKLGPFYSHAYVNTRKTNAQKPT